MDNPDPFSVRKRAVTPASSQAGFGVAPILYMLGLIGVGAGILFSSYSQTLRTNISMTNNLGAKSDLDASATTLAATSVLGQTNAAILCPPQGGIDTAGSNCALAPAKMTELDPTDNVSASDAHLPAFGFGGGNNNWAYMRNTAVEVGIFVSGAGVKQVDPWGHYYIYCRWENDTAATTPAIQIISAGSSGTLNTRCGALTVSTSPDNYMISMDAANAINRSSVWQTGVTGSSTPDVYYGTVGHQLEVDANGNLTVPGNITTGGNYASNAGSIGLTSGNVTLTSGTFYGNLAGGTVAGTTANFSSTLAAENSAFTVGTGGIVSAVNNAFTVGAGGTLSAASGIVTVDSSGDLTVGTSAFVVAGATGNTTIVGTLGVSGATTLSTLIAHGVTNVGNNAAASGTPSVLLSAGQKNGGGVYPFFVDQYGDVNAAELNGSSVTDGGAMTVTGNYTSTSGNITLTNGTVTAAAFSGNIALGSGGVNLTGVVPISNGGTGATTATTALDNLGVTSGGYLSTSLLTTNFIPGADLTNNSVSSTQLTTTGVAAGTYTTVTVSADGRVTSGTYAPGNPTTLTDGNGDYLTIGSSLNITLGSAQQADWTTTGLMVGTSTPPKNRLDVYGAEAIGTSYAGIYTAPQDGLIVAGSTGIGTSSPVSALQVVGTVTATNFAGSGANLTNIGTSSLSGTISTGNGGTGTSTTFTQGSVVFAGASGIYSQDNANFFWNDTTHRLGIATASPASAVQLLNGEVQVGSSGASCSSTVGGAIRYSGGNLYYCDGGSTWQAVGTSGAYVGTSSLSGTVQVTQGGTGDTSLTAHSVMLGEGVSSVGTAGPGAANTVLIGNGVNADPSFSGSPALTSLTLSGLDINTLGADYTTTGAQADVALGAYSSVRYNGSGTATFYGIVAGSNGQILRLHNASGSTLTLSNQNTGSESTAANRIITGINNDLPIPTNTSVTLQYDGTSARWRVTGSSNAAQALAAGSDTQIQYNNNGAMAGSGGLVYTYTNGYVGVGTTAPNSLVQAYNGEVQVGSSGSSCSNAKGGAVRFSGSTLYYCDGSSTWQSLQTGTGSFTGSYTGSTITVPYGGTGETNLTAHSLMLGEGTAAVGTAGPGAINTVLIGKGATVDPAFTGAPIISGALTTSQSIGVTSTDGIVLSNTTAAAAGAQQFSPRVHFTGQGWKTTATAASQSIDFIQELQPVQGTTAATGNLTWSSSVNGSAYSNLMALTSGGYLGLGTSTPLYLLDLVGVGTTNAGNVHLKNLVAHGIGPRLILDNSGGYGQGSLDFYTIGGANPLTVNPSARWLGVDDNYYSANMLFQSAFNSGAMTTNMIIIGSTGYIGVGTASPNSRVQAYAGEVQVGSSGNSCSGITGGAVRFSGSNLYYCDGSSTWQTVGTSGTTITGTYAGSTITVPYGGTGETNLTAHSVMLGEGASAVGTAGPGAINTVLIGNGASADPSFTGAPTISGALTTSQSIGVTSTDGIVLSNTTAAAAGAQQYSPRIHFTGQGWKTNSTAASQSIDFIEEVQPVQGTAAATGNLAWSSSVNGGVYGNLMTLTSGGLLGLGTASPTYDISLGGNAAREIWQERSTAGAGNNLRIQSGGALSGATDAAGGNLILSSGIATGTGTSNIYFYTPYTLTSSGTADRSPGYPAMVIYGQASSTGTNTPSFGRVGIGTANPTNSLDVWSYASGSGNGGISVHNGFGATGSIAAFTAINDLNIGANFGMAGSGGFASLPVAPASSGYISMPAAANSLVLVTAGTTSASNILFATGGTATTNERMRITNAGLIGIGTTAPNSLVQAYNGEVQVGSSGNSCSSAKGGAVRFSGSNLYYCDGGSTWQSIGTSGGTFSGSYTGSTITVPYGGTGETTLTAHSLMLGEGSAAVGTAGPGAINTVLIGNGVNADPSFSGSPALTSLTLSGVENLTVGTDYTTTGSQPDVALGSFSTVRYAGTGPATFYGIVAGSSGQVLYLHNASGSTLTLSNQNTGSESTAANRIITGINNDLPIPTNTSVTLQYDGTSARWRVTGSSNAAQALAAGSDTQIQYNNNGAMAGTSGLVFDYTNTRLGVGTTTPGYAADIRASATTGIIAVTNQSSSGYSSIVFRDNNVTNQTALGYGNSGVAAPWAGTSYFSSPTAPMVFITNSLERMRVTNGGSVGVGTTSPNSLVQAYNGEVQVGSSGNSCSGATGGAVRFSGSNLYYCDGSSTWQAIGTSGASVGTASLSGTLQVSQGGTGETNLTAHSLMLGEGTAAVGTAGPGAINTVLIGKGATVDPAFTGAPTISGALTTSQSIGVTSTDGIVLSNTTAAAAGAQQYSPRVHFTGQGWKTAATAASQSIDFIEELQPIQGTAAPTGNLTWSNSVNGGAYSPLMTLTSGGFIGLGTTSPTYDISFSASAAHEIWTERSTTGAGNNLTIQAGGALSGATDTAGGNLIFNSGISTGSASSSILFNIPSPIATGNTDHVPNFPALNIQGQANGGVGIAYVHVGIGTAKPGNALDVWSSGSGSGNGGMQIHNTSALSGSASYLSTNNDSGYGATFGTTSSGFNSYPVIPTNSGYIYVPSTLNSLVFVTQGTTNTANIIFATGGNATTNERIRINSTGLVGIGTTNPTSVLHTYDVAAKTAAYTGVLHGVYDTSSTASVNKIGMDVESTGSWTGTSAVNTGLVVNATGGSANYAATFNGGNVGIGTTSPNSLVQAYGGEVQVGSSGNACSGTTGGAVRFSGSNLYYCDGSSTWQTVATGGTYSGGTITVPYGGTGDTTLTAHSLMLGEGSAAVGTAGPGAINTVLIGNGPTSDPSFTGAPTISGALTTLQSIGVTSTDGIVLSNTTAATSSVSQYSPRVHFTGQGWKTTATAASQSIDFIEEVQPVQGTTAPTGNLTWSSSVNGGAYGNLMTLTSGGLLGLGTASPTYDISLGGNAAREIWTERSTTGAGNNLTIQAGGGLSGGTDKAGGNLILSSGISTGSQQSGIYFQVPPGGLTGTTDRVPTTGMAITEYFSNGQGSQTRVGINSSIPGDSLVVYGFGNGSGSGHISIQNGSNLSGASGALFAYSDNNSNYTAFGHTATSWTSYPVIPGATGYMADNNGITLVVSNSGATNAIRFATGGTATTNERMRISNAGLVGIGTTNPTSLLHSYDAAAQTAAYTGVLHGVYDTSSTASIAKIGMDVESTGAWTGTGAVNTGLVVNATGGTTNYAATFNGGNVGIGTTAPNGLLDVYGGHMLASRGGTAPIVSSCGTSPTISGTDNSFLITVGTGTATSCTVTFGAAWTTAPNACIFSPGNATAAASGTAGTYVSAISTTQMTLTGANLTSSAFYVHCY